MTKTLPKLALSFLVTFLSLFFISAASQAQGFKKLDLGVDKFGSSDQGSSSAGPNKNSGTQTSATNNNSNQSGGVSLNGTDLDLKEMVQMMSTLTGKQFIFDDKKITGKITIISDKTMTPDEAYQAFLSSLEINGLTTVMTPTGMINIIPQKDTSGKPLDLYKGNSPNEDRIITRIVQLNNISANEIGTILKSMGTKTSIVPYPTTNSLIMTDTGSNIDYLLKLIRELDQEGPQEVLDIIPVVNADAKDIADKISTIFENKDSGGGSSTVVRRRGSRSAGGNELEDVQNISKILADERTNSILIMGTKRAIIKVRALIARLDVQLTGADGRIHVYRLRFAKAKDMADVLSKLVQDSGGKDKKSAKAGPGANSGVDLEGGVQVTADEAINALIVVASPKDYDTLVSNVIEKLDVVRPQVYLEAVIMSLDVKKTSQVGVSGLGGLLNTLQPGGEGLTSFGAILPSTPGSISTIAGASGGFAGGVISDKTISLPLSDGSTADVPAISAIISALATDSDANVLSTPNIMVLDNEDAKIQVGQEVPVQSGTTISTGITTFNVTREDVGIILDITPQISENENVRLKIKQEITNVINKDPNLGPTLDKKSVETAVLAKNKQTIVIGGLIDDKATIETKKVPLLGDIPVLGSLFRNRSTDKTKSNLIVFITPYIIRERADYLAILKKKIEERNHFIDINYGTSQKKLIRRSITDHAKDLLEFKCQTSEEGDCPKSDLPSESADVLGEQNQSNGAFPAQTSHSYDPPKKTVYR